MPSSPVVEDDPDARERIQRQIARLTDELDRRTRPDPNRGRDRVRES